jgi:hypothetical protein
MYENKEENIIVSLPGEFIQRIEQDLNKITISIPDILSSHYEFLKDEWNYSNAFEFLVGMMVGNCQFSYIQAFDQIYEKMPTGEQTEEIHNMISRRKIQFEQGVSAFKQEFNLTFQVKQCIQI